MRSVPLTQEGAREGLVPRMAEASAAWIVGVGEGGVFERRLTPARRTLTLGLLLGERRALHLFSCGVPTPPANCASGFSPGALSGRK